MKVKRLDASYVIEDGVELILTMDCESTEEFAMNWLAIYNNARENSNTFLHCKLLYNSDIIVLVRKEDELIMKEYLMHFGTVECYDCKFREIDYDIDFDYDTDYDIIASEH